MSSSPSTTLQQSSAAVAAQAAFLRANSDAYERLVRRIDKTNLRKHPEAVLSEVAFAAQAASEFHPGRFADGAIENMALEIGAALSAGDDEDGLLIPASTCQDSRRRVLHVATQVRSIGGHTRMLYHWVRNDQSSCHSLVIVNQGEMPVPVWLDEVVQDSGGQVVVFPPEFRLYKKAKQLREIAKRSADLVVLHHYPFDVVPTVAFASHECPPVALLNIADHQFWLGSSIADIVINLRTAGSKHTARSRFVSSNTVLPIPLADQVAQPSRRDARRLLGIQEDQVVLLSVGRAEKYRPCGKHDFVGTARKILERYPNAHLYVVGESLAGITRFLRSPVHKRLHFLGSMEDPSLYRSAADIYLESFPFGSQTALLEAALGGLPVVPAYAPMFPLLVANDDAVRDLIPNPRDEQEYIDKVNLLIQYPECRAELGGMLRKRLTVDHVGDGWLNRLAAIYQETDHLLHNPQPIPATSCTTSDADISLSVWHAVADGKDYTADISGDGQGAVLRHTAFVAKYLGDYQNARRFAWRAVLHDPFRRCSWRLLVITLLGRVEKVLRYLQRRSVGIFIRR